MRAYALIPLCFVAACSAEAGADQKAKPATLALDAGQWETTTEVTRLDVVDGGTPAVAMAVGDKIVTSNCVGAEEVKKPAAVVFAGIDKADCSYDTFYMSRGRLNAAMTCTQPGLGGKMMVSTDGNFTATGFEATSDMRTILSGPGDVSVATKVSGRRTGDCTAKA